MRRASLALGALLLIAGCGERSEVLPEPGLRVTDVLGAADPTGFARALEPRAFTFPRDHGPHPAFRNEWWYVTGNLRDADGAAIGYQLTIFRTSLAPPTPQEGTERASAWAADQAYMGHLAVGDAERGVFRARERFDRGALGLAGSRAEPLRVWIEGWVIEEADDATPAPAPATPPLHLRAEAEGVGIDLTLRAERPVVLNGDRGLSRKGSEPGNASYYYSVPRLATEGRVTLDGRDAKVHGVSWLDREWSTSALEAGQVGWDWFALHLSDGRDLMLYLMRRDDGTVDPASGGTWVEPDGSARPLRRADLDVAVTDHAAAASGVVYPAGWRVRVPSERLDLTIRPRMRDQELDLAFRYWEGAVEGEGRLAGADVRVEGFVEMTGYADHADAGGDAPGR